MSRTKRNPPCIECGRPENDGATCPGCERRLHFGCESEFGCCSDCTKDVYTVRTAEENSGAVQ